MQIVGQKSSNMSRHVMSREHTKPTRETTKLETQKWLVSVGQHQGGQKDPNDTVSVGPFAVATFDRQVLCSPVFTFSFQPAPRNLIHVQNTPRLSIQPFTTAQVM